MFGGRGITIDNQDRVITADQFTNCVRCTEAKDKHIHPFEFGKEGTGKGEFRSPMDVKFDSKNQRFLVADRGNNRIQAFDLQGNFLFSFGSKGKGNSKFDAPSGLTVDHAGNIFVSDTNNHRVQVFDEKGHFLRKFGSEGTGQGELTCPYGIGILSSGDVVVSETSRLSCFSSQGEFIRFIGEGKVEPWWIFVDSKDNILVPHFGDEITTLSTFSKEGDLLSEEQLYAITHKIFGVVKDHMDQVFFTGQYPNC